MTPAEFASSAGVSRQSMTGLAGNEGIDDLKISVKKLSVILRTAGQLVSKSANLDEVSAGMGRVAESLDQLRQSLRANETSRTRGLPENPVLVSS